MQDFIDINTVVSPDDPETIIKLLEQYVGREWSNNFYTKDLSGEQLQAIWLENKDKIMKNEMLKNNGNEIFSESNFRIKKSFKSCCDSLENWLFNIYEQLNSENPNWEEIKRNLGDTEEDEIEFNYIKKTFLKDPEIAIKIYREELDDDLEKQARNFIFKKESQYQENMVSKQELINHITGNDDLTKTEYGPINDSAKLENNFDSKIVNEAINDASKFAPVLNKTIYIMSSGESGPYGIVETELQSKLAKIKIINELSGYPDEIKESDAIEIIKKLEEEFNKGAIAFRVNPLKIATTTEELMSQVEAGAISSGLGDLVLTMYDEVLKLAMGSVIAHEAEHTVKMTSKDGDPDDESRAENTENSFIDQMLKEEKFKIIRPFINRKGNEISDIERESMINEIKEKYVPQNKISENNWYKIKA